MAEPLRVALCDDHHVVRSGLRHLLEDEPGIEVVGEAASADEAVAVARAQQPDVFVMDLALPGEGGISAIRRIRDAVPATRVVVLTMHDDVAYLREAFAAGASGYVVKRAADVELVLAIRAIAGGERYVHSVLGAALLNDQATVWTEQAAVPELSPREVDVLRLLALGHTNAEMAALLHLSVRTIETHRNSLQQKLGLRSRAELARFAREAGVAP